MLDGEYNCGRMLTDADYVARITLIMYIEWGVSRITTYGQINSIKFISLNRSRNVRYEINSAIYWIPLRLKTAFLAVVINADNLLSENHY